MSSVIAAFDAEIAELEAALAADQRVVRLRELKRMRDDYMKISGNGPYTAPTMPWSAAVPASGGGGGGFGKAAPGRKPSPERVRALQETKALLTGRQGPTRTADILAHLNERAIYIGGDKPQNNRSAMLYHSPDFQSHGRSGWTLKNRSAET